MEYQFCVSDLRTDNWLYASLETLGQVIEEMLGQGLQPSDIGIVVEAKECTTTALEQGQPGIETVMVKAGEEAALAATLRQYETWRRTLAEQVQKLMADRGLTENHFGITEPIHHWTAEDVHMAAVTIVRILGLR